MSRYHRHSGITLVEILVVIAIIGVFGLALSNIDLSKNFERENRDRLASKIVSNVRHAKMVAVSGKTATAGGCGSYVLKFHEAGMTGSLVEMSQTWSVSRVCGTDSETSIAAPIFGDSNFRITDITAYDREGNLTYRVANASDFGGNQPAGLAANSVGIFIRGSDLQAFPLNCANELSCVDYARDKAVRLKIHAAYRESYGTRDANLSRDIWMDLRSGNVNVSEPVTP